MRTLQTKPQATRLVVGRSRTSRSRWVAAWCGLAVLGVANGAVRQAGYASLVGDDTAHQISTFTLVALVAGYAWWLQRRWPLPDRRTALQVGGAWVAMTLAFELGFGHYVVGTSWADLMADYDLLAGRLWLLVPMWLAVAPEVTRRMVRRP